MKGEYLDLSLDKIVSPEISVRSDLSPESVEDLVNSIKQIGIIEPLVVHKKGKLYEVVAGERRSVAAKIAGLTSVPCRVIKADKWVIEEMKLHENLARADISAIDWANHLDALKKHYKVSTAELGKKIGMSEAWVQERLAILNYPDQLKEALGSGSISQSAAYELSRIKDPRKLRVYSGHAIRGGVTPALAKRWRQEANSEAPGPSQAPIVEVEKPQEEAPPPKNTPCPVCSKEVAPEKAVSIVVHEKCLPN